MKFQELIPKIKNGEKVRRTWWHKENYIYCNLYNSESFKSNLDDVRVLCAGDVCADDWELYEEEKKLIDWSQAHTLINKMESLEERIRLLEEK